MSKIEEFVKAHKSGSEVSVLLGGERVLLTCSPEDLNALLLSLYESLIATGAFQGDYAEEIRSVFESYGVVFPEEEGK